MVVLYLVGDEPVLNLLPPSFAVVVVAGAVEDLLSDGEELLLRFFLGVSEVDFLLDEALLAFFCLKKFIHTN